MPMIKGMLKRYVYESTFTTILGRNKPIYISAKFLNHRRYVHL